MLRWLKKNKLFKKALKRRFKGRLFSRGLKRILRKVFEYKRIKQVVGVNLLSAAVLVSQISTPVSALQTYPEAELTTLPAVEIDGVKEVELETRSGFQTPVENFRVSQGYHLFHLAVDLAAPIGSPIKSIAQGTVERVEYGRWGYGNSILINHGSNLKSFYAHMGRIKVKKGDEINIDEVVGTVGVSGRATGPHLHLEIWQNDRPLNPRVVLDLKTISNLAKAK